MANYCCSDIHGQYDLYERMVSCLDLAGDDTLYILGDIIDRGPDSIGIMMDIIRRVDCGEHIVCLLGNHELMMHRHFDELYRALHCDSYWTRPGNGGYETLCAFEKCSDDDKTRIFDFIESFWLQKEIMIGDKTFLLSHSAFLGDKGDVLWNGDRDNCTISEFVTWNSPWRFWEYVSKDAYKEDKRWHVIGHVPIQRAYLDDMREVRPEEMLDITPEEFISQMPIPYIDNRHRIINIDLGCAGYPGDDENGILGAGLLCVSLDAYVAGEADFYRVFR